MHNMNEDQDELLPATDDDSVSENEDQCLPVDKPENYRRNFIYVEHTKIEFVIVKTLLILSTLSVLIILPLYMETVNVKGDVYSLLLTNTFLSAVILILLTIAIKLFFSKYKYIHILKLPMNILKLAQLSFIYFSCAVMIIYALDRKRVLCHLQDPIKGLVLVWSFLYYFFFCQRFMCLQRIFSVTVIIVGLFIALDYNLCNEFKCRGYERQHVADDTGNWTWQAHAVWTTVYIAGLALFAAYFTVLEHTLIEVIKMLRNTRSTSLLTTVSRSVSTNSASSSLQDEAEDTQVCKKINAVHLSMWLHVLGVIILVALFWTDFIPQIGKGSNSTTVLNYTSTGIRCHFSSDPDCHDLVITSWLFLCAYLAFVITSIQFLILTQSAVYTIATMTTALPLAGIWWSLVHVVPIENGLLVWKPSFTGELISSFLGLPIIMIGLYFLAKSHFKDSQWCRSITNHSLPTSHCS